MAASSLTASNNAGTSTRRPFWTAYARYFGIGTPVRTCLNPTLAGLFREPVEIGGFCATQSLVPAARPRPPALEIGAPPGHTRGGQSTPGAPQADGTETCNCRRRHGRTDAGRGAPPARHRSAHLRAGQGLRPARRRHPDEPERDARAPRHRARAAHPRHRVPATAPGPTATGTAASSPTNCRSAPRPRRNTARPIC